MIPPTAARARSFLPTRKIFFHSTLPGSLLLRSSWILSMASATTKTMVSAAIPMISAVCTFPIPSFVLDGIVCIILMVCMLYTVYMLYTILICLSSDNQKYRASADRKRSMFRCVGWTWPRSHREMLLCLTPMISASSCWLRPASSRAKRKSAS